MVAPVAVMLELDTPLITGITGLPVYTATSFPSRYMYSRVCCARAWEKGNNVQQASKTYIMTEQLAGVLGEYHRLQESSIGISAPCRV